MIIQTGASTKLAAEETIKNSIHNPKDQKTWSNLHEKVGVECMSIENWENYYRLAAIAILKDQESVKIYTTKRIELLNNQHKTSDNNKKVTNDSNKALQGILNAYPALMTIQEEDEEIQKSYAKSLENTHKPENAPQIEEGKVRETDTIEKEKAKATNPKKKTEEEITDENEYAESIGDAEG